VKRILHGVVRGKAGGGFAGAYIVSTCDFVKRTPCGTRRYIFLHSDVGPRPCVRHAWLPARAVCAM